MHTGLHLPECPPICCWQKLSVQHKKLAGMAIILMPCSGLLSCSTSDTAVKLTGKSWHLLRPLLLLLSPLPLPSPPPLLPLLLPLPTSIPALLILLLLLSPLCIFPCRFSSSSSCSLLLPLALSNTAQSAANFRYSPALSSPPPHETASRKQVYSSTNSLSMSLQGRTGARAVCRFSPPEERPDQPTEQATCQQQAVGLRHDGSAAPPLTGCLVPGAVQRRYACCARPHDQLEAQLSHAPTHG